MNKQEEISLLLDKYNAGEASAEEQALLESWYLQYPLQNRPVRSDQLEDLDLAEVEHKLLGTLEAGKREVSLWPRIAVAAAAVAVITLGTWIYTSSISSRHPEAGQDLGSAQYTNDIKPGRNSARLRLANGKTINLSDTKTGVVINVSTLTYSDGEELDISSKTVEPLKESRRDAKSKVMSVSTPRGGTYQVVLPDGTEVWLNAASSIVFPSSFAGAKKRSVELQGEAYFQVAKDKKHPFIVESQGQEVEVLGTHFNISSYAEDGATKTTLLKGSVKVAYTPGDEVILKPNQQATKTGNGISIKQIDAAEAAAWKDGMFSFTSQDMASILRVVARWYDAEIVFKDTVQDVVVTGSMPRFSKLSTVLNKLALTGTVKFEIKGKKIVVMKAK